MKARIKNLLLSGLGIFAAFSAITTTSSCNEDKCKAIVCAYGGTCNDGECICPNGYEGPQCETITVLKYQGSWDVLETGSRNAQPSKYTLWIDSVAGDKTAVKIMGFNNLATTVKGFINGDTLHIREQLSGHYYLQGKGILDRDKYYGETAKLIIRYEITDTITKLTNDFGWTTNQEASVWNKLK